MNQLLNCSNHFANNKTFELNFNISSAFSDNSSDLLVANKINDNNSDDSLQCLLNNFNNESSSVINPIEISNHLFDLNAIRENFTTSINGTDYYQNEAFDGAPHYEWTYMFVIVFIFAGGLGNILVCLAVALDKKLQNVTNYFLLSLAVADLLVSLFVMPLGAVPAFLGEFIGISEATSLLVKINKIKLHKRACFWLSLSHIMNFGEIMRL